ncbi:MAG: molybdopterin-dependent oxidoreductase [Actinobacteria bacterium]|nr:molybdopterin-dependent oxidoreductase [Actinomycetota bacterium]
MAGELHMRIVRSPVAHARITHIDVEAALELPGVVAIWTGRDTAEIPPIDFRQEGLTDLYPYRQPILAEREVRYVGEPLAAVFARDPYAAEDAADLVFVDFDELDVVVDPRADPAPFDEDSDTEAALVNVSYGDVEAAFAAAHRRVTVEVSVGRHTGVPMETRGALAVREHHGRIVMYGAAKVPHYNRQAIALMLGLGIDDVVLREGHVGGGFGVRGELYPEDVLVCLAALRLNAPVKWIEDRKEHLVATNHSRDQVHVIEAAVDADGFITAVRDEFWLDQGAYVRSHAATVPNLTAAMLPGPYVIPAYECRGHIRLTNKTPAGTYRAPGRYEGTFARERLLDAVAAELGEDPIVTRRRNLIAHEDMPFARPIRALGTEMEYDSGDYPSILEKTLAYVDDKGLCAELDERRASEEWVGLGFAFFVEKSGLGPYEGARIDVDDDGGIRVVTGAASMGQGVETAIAQVCGDVLDVSVDGIRVVHGQTDEIDYGLGAFASRVTVMTGTATQMAARALLVKAREAAAHLLEADPADIGMVAGNLEVVGAPERRVSLAEVARSLDPSGAKRTGMVPTLSAEAWFTTEHMTYPYGVHAALVRVDEWTGGVEILRYVVAYDIGKAVNPMLVRGQIVGGAAQGLGGALLEEFVYSDDGQPLATSFMDYLLPTVTEMPPVDVLLLEDAPTPLNPMGVKGAGEGGTTAFGAAVAAAIDDALDAPGAVTRLPVSPERLRKVICNIQRSPREKGER